MEVDGELRNDSGKSACTWFRGVHSKVIARYPVSNGIDIGLKIVKINGAIDGLVKKDVISIQQYLGPLRKQDLTGHLYNII